MRRAGRLLKLVPAEDIMALYYVCRLFSAVLFCGSLLLLAAAFSRVARSFNGTAGLGFFFILFLPQFSVLSVSVNPEAAATFWGALFFYAAAAWISGTAGRPVLALLPVASLAGFLTDRSSFYLVPAALLLPLFSGKRERPARSPARIGLFMILALIVASWAAWFFPGTVFSGLSSVQNFLFRAPIVPAEAIARGRRRRALSPPLFGQHLAQVRLDGVPGGGVVYYAWRAAAVLASWECSSSRRPGGLSAGQPNPAKAPRPLGPAG